MKDLEKIKIILKKFTERNVQIAIAESCTGGYVCHMITNISGASKVFDRGVVCYSNKAKVEQLNVNPLSIEKYGAVSKEVAEQMAINVRKQSKVNVGIGITGIAGPTGGTPEKPVGLVYIGFSTEKETIIEKHVFKADRIAFKKKVLTKVLQLLENY
jgi:nicotinamide-nucleotide amidase